MKLIKALLLIQCMIVTFNAGYAQDLNVRIDSLVNHLRTAGREWNEYSKPLIEIGESAVPFLVKAAEDQSLSQWNRRITIITLNNIHSPKWVTPALKILFDRDEDSALRNHVTAGLKGYDLSEVKDELWRLYEEVSKPFYRLNLAHLLLTADTSLAYRSFHELYSNNDGYVQRTALLNLVKIRPSESTAWFLDAVKKEDWMTSNLAMDSLVLSEKFRCEELISLYNQSGSNEKLQWRIVFVFGHREDPKSVKMLTEALQNESWLVHTEAAVGLCRFDPELVIPVMKELKNSSIRHVRDNSKWVIKHLKSSSENKEIL